jgi:hypothetical protein
LVGELRSVDLAAPHVGEREPTYTRRCLTEPVQKLLRDLRVPGLLVAGEQTGPVRPVWVLGNRFFPDITVSYHAQPLIAIEVKYVRGGSSVAVALGQAVLYGLVGYARTVMFLIDREAKVSPTDVANAMKLIKGAAGTELILRAQRHSKLVPQVA